MNPLLPTKGEIELLIDDNKNIAIESLEVWQVDWLLASTQETNITVNNLKNIDQIVTVWLSNLTKQDWIKIKRQHSLHNIPLPTQWIKVWRFILKTPNLRNASRITQLGTQIGTYQHLWNFWAEECLQKYTNDLDKELIKLVDEGYLYSEIGEILLHKYGDEFWKPRKINSKTTPAQVVNNYLFKKIPEKICRNELLDICLNQLKKKPKLKEITLKEYFVY